jgi:sirohydrochlorin cobaltochelatase
MLILIAHGSPNEHWRASVEQLAEAVRSDLGQDTIRLAYLGCTPPSLAEVVSDAVRAGARKIRVLPLFLTAEGHVLRDLHPLVDQLAKDYDRVDWELLPPVGRHPLFRELLGTIAREAAD